MSDTIAQPEDSEAALKSGTNALEPKDAQEMDEAQRQAIKAARVLIRHVVEHLRQGHIRTGTTETQAGFVDVVTHPTSKLPILNYVTPRRNTAWVSGKHIADGLNMLHEKDRSSMFMFPDLLFPPIFNKTLTSLGLHYAQKTPIFAFDATNKTFMAPVPPTAITIQPATAGQSMGIWWYIWRNGNYNLTTSSVDPLRLNYEQKNQPGRHINLIVRRYNTPVGAARLTLHDKTAHVAATALLHDIDTPDMRNLLLAYCLRYVLKTDCNVIFVSGQVELQADAPLSARNQTQKDHALSLGFIDAGNIVCYAEAATTVTDAEGQHGSLAQPVFIT